jgi:hypothetical protein
VRESIFWVGGDSVLNLDTSLLKTVRTRLKTERVKARHGNENDTVLCPDFRKFDMARHGTIKALDTVQNDTGTRHGTK